MISVGDDCGDKRLWGQQNWASNLLCVFLHCLFFVWNFGFFLVFSFLFLCIFFMRLAIKTPPARSLRPNNDENECHLRMLRMLRDHETTITTNFLALELPRSSTTHTHTHTHTGIRADSYLIYTSTLFGHRTRTFSYVAWNNWGFPLAGGNSWTARPDAFRFISSVFPYSKISFCHVLRWYIER